MRRIRINLWEKDEYHYPMAFGFVPNLVTYLHEDNEKKARPCMLVVPGGGYCVVSPTEGEIVAKKFFNKGYNAFVLTYTTNVLMAEPLKLQPLKDISRAIRLIRKNASDYRIDPNKVALCGFSAGGHLCASICVHFDDIKEENEGFLHISNRPDAAILCYPVITSGPMAHRDSFIALLGKDATEEELEYMSLEKQVTKNTPPCFLWHTATDELVPVENSYYFADELKKHGIPYGLHIFSEGRHGLSLADEVWAKGQYGDPYTMEQVNNIVEKVKSGDIALNEKKKEDFLKMFDSGESNNQENVQQHPNAEVAIWPEIAEKWLERILSL
jgi:acetyl esterase/lipase